MNGISRHIACRSCRDRKIRCGGEQPTCEKCRRSGDDCVYVPTQKPTKSDLTQTINALQKRLEEAETRIRRMSTSKSPAPQTPRPQSRHTQQQQQPAQTQQATQSQPQPPTQNQADVQSTQQHVQNQQQPPRQQVPQQQQQQQQPVSYNFMWPMPTDFNNPVPYHCTIPNFISNGQEEDTSPLSPQSYANLFHQPPKQLLPNDTLRNGQGTSSSGTTLNGSSGSGSNSNHSGQDGEDRFMEGNDAAESDMRTRIGSPFVLDHLNEFPPTANLNSNGVSNNGGNGFGVLQSSVGNGTGQNNQTNGSRPLDAAAAVEISAQLKAFSTAVFHAQHELAGMATALAEYIAWMSKVPSGMNPPNTKLVFANVLDTIQERLMELSDLAKTKHQAPFRNMVASLEKLPDPHGSALAGNLASIEDEAEKRGDEVLKFFQTKYNACILLSEQSKTFQDHVKNGTGQNGAAQQTT